MDSGYLERLESERFGPSRSRAEHLDALTVERYYSYVIPSSEPSRKEVDFWREYMWRKKFPASVRRLADQLRKEIDYGKD